MTDDVELLRQYAEEGSDAAFTELVSRRLGLVYAAALRQVGGDAEAAKDAAQTVFVDLARKAGSLWRREVLTGWLYTSARYAAAKVARKELRRRNRERSLAAMQTPVVEPAAEPSWNDLSPCLDDAMAELTPAERNAVLLRFFNRLELKSVGAALGISEDAARMRVNRALESLRALLLRRGVTLSAATLAAVLSGEAITAAPSGLAAGIAGTALASAGAGGMLSLSLLKPMLLTKLKLAVVGGAMVAGVATPLWLQHQTQGKLRQENQALQQQVETLRAANEQRGPTAGAGAGASERPSQERELLRLRGEVSRLRLDLAEITNQHAQPGPVTHASEPPENAPIISTVQAQAEMQVPNGGTLLMGGWNAGNGKQLLLFSTPRIEGARADEIVIRSQFLEIPESVLSSLGLASFNAGSARPSPTQLLAADEAESLLKLLKDTEGVTLVSQPAISTVGGQEANLFIGETRVFGGKTNDIGQKLQFLPTIADDGKSVTMKLGVELSRLVKNL